MLAASNAYTSAIEGFHCVSILVSHLGSTNTKSFKVIWIIHAQTKQHTGEKHTWLLDYQYHHFRDVNKLDLDLNDQLLQNASLLASFDKWIQSSDARLWNFVQIVLMFIIWWLLLKLRNWQWILSSIVWTRILTHCQISTENPETYCSVTYVKPLYHVKLYNLRLCSCSSIISLFLSSSLYKLQHKLKLLKIPKLLKISK